MEVYTATYEMSHKGDMSGKLNTMCFMYVCMNVLYICSHEYICEYTVCEYIRLHMRARVCVLWVGVLLCDLSGGGGRAG